MKKLLLLFSFLFLVASTIQSQSFSLSSLDGPIPSNGEYGILEPPSADEVHAYIFVTNNSSTDKAILVKRDDVYLLPDAISSFCWNGSCYPPFVYEASDPLPVASGATTTSNDFYGLYSPEGQKGTSKVRFTFFDADNPDDSVSVLVRYITGFVGTGDLLASQQATISKPYPNPASSVVTFDISLKAQAEDAVLVVRNMLGMVVNQYAVTNRTGKLVLPVNEYKEGIYFYTLIVNDNLQVETGRFIVRR